MEDNLRAVQEIQAVQRTRKSQALRVVSLFDGISCGRLALERQGYAVSYYAAFEIDKYAKAISRHQYPDILHLGDVMTADFAGFTDIDVVVGGSPCQKFSIAQSKSREIEKGGMGWELFMKYVEAVRTIKPAYFLYENVASMHKNMRQYITEELGCEPVMINSALVSAQQRKRLYWTNIKGVTQPDDTGVLLKDILETGITTRDKSLCIDACYGKGGNHKSPHKQSGKRLMVYDEIIHANAVGAALRTRSDKNGSFKRLEIRSDDKLNSLTTVQTDSVICTPCTNTLYYSQETKQPIRIGIIGKGGQGERIYSVKGKTVTLSSTGGGRGSNTGLYKIDLPDGDYTIRKLTVTEAERCQTLDDGYTALGIDDKGKLINISNTQRYKAIGNGWTVSVIAHILSFMEVFQ